MKTDSKLIILILSMIILYGCRLLPIDRYYTGGKKVGDKMCWWRVDTNDNNQKYCSISDDMFPKEKLIYSKCTSCEDYIKSLDKTTKK